MFHALRKKTSILTELLGTEVTSYIWGLECNSLNCQFSSKKPIPRKQDVDYSGSLKDFSLSEPVSLYNICAGTDHAINANSTASLSLISFR